MKHRHLIPALFFALFSFASIANKIQIAILLDGSGSMQGLIDQTQFQLSSIINELENARYQGEIPRLEIALFEHGKDNLTEEQGYLQKLSDLVSDPDIVNAKIFQITANGSEEYTGLAIKTAVDTLQWDLDPIVYKAIFIAGNETMNQGPVHYMDAVQHAVSRGIIVNTIFAGDATNEDFIEWQNAATAGNGAYANISSEMNLDIYVTKYDQDILALNHQLNFTYVTYGPNGADGLERMLDLDGRMAGNLVDRASTKSGNYYDSSDWDLVAAWKAGKVVVSESMDRSILNEEMANMSEKEMLFFLENKFADRTTTQKRIQDLSILRNDDVQMQMKENTNSASATVRAAISAALKAQLARANFTL